MTLAELCDAVADAGVPAGAAGLEIGGVHSDSREMEAGGLFIAVPGEIDDGREHVDAAVARGAIAIVSETELTAPVPVVLVPDARSALADIAATWYGRPVDSLHMVGITGTVGKTSVLAMLDAILGEAGIAAGTIGSLGIGYEGRDNSTPNTTPGALQLQHALADMAAAGVRIAAMEVTSHALVQGRVRGLSYDLGIFTNLTMLEHMEYHGSFRSYAEAKLQFLDYLKRDAPLVYPVGDRAVRAAVRRHTGPLISCGGRGADVTIRRRERGVHGASITLDVRRGLPRLDAVPLPPGPIPVELSSIGRTNIGNASIAAVAALCLGAHPDAVRTALAAFESPPRRLQVLRTDGPIIIDDTVGHPDSITGVFEVAQNIRHHHLYVVFCVRGQRGPAINERDAEALAIWSRTVPVHALHITSAIDSADERNSVTAEERSAFTSVIERSGMGHRHHDRLEDAITAVLGDAAEKDLVLLLGAQGMDAGAGMVGRILDSGHAHDSSG